MVVMTTVSFYLITVYTPTFGKNVLKLAESGQPAGDLLRSALSNFIWLPVIGRAVGPDRPPPVLIAFTLLALLTAYPALAWLVGGPTFGKMLLVELWLSFALRRYNGAMVVALTEVDAGGCAHRRLLAGLQPGHGTVRRLHAGISTWLIRETGDKAAPGYWMMFAALCGLVATLLIMRGGRGRRRRGPRSAACGDLRARCAAREPKLDSPRATLAAPQPRACKDTTLSLARSALPRSVKSDNISSDESGSAQLSPQSDLSPGSIDGGTPMAVFARLDNAASTPHDRVGLLRMPSNWLGIFPLGCICLKSYFSGNCVICGSPCK